MTEAIFHVDSEGEFWERASEAESAAASEHGHPLVHVELGGSGVFWRRVDPLVEAEAIRQRSSERNK